MTVSQSQAAGHGSFPPSLPGESALMKTWKSAIIALLIPLTLSSCRESAVQDGPPPPPPVPAQPHHIALFKLGGGSDQDDVPAASLKQGMKLFQFQEGAYYKLEVIDLEGKPEVFPDRLARAIRDGADLIAITHPSVLQAALGLEVAPPMVFGILGDPLVLGVGTSKESHRPGLTGAFHAFPAQSLLAAAKFYLPEAKRVGVLFNSRDPLSVAHKDALVRDSAHSKLEVVAIDSEGSTDLTAATDTLLSQSIDAIGLATGLGSSTSSVIEQARARKVPVFGIRESQVRQGAIAAEVPILERVGVETGRMIYRVLSGEKPAAIPLAQLIDTEAVVSPKAAEALAITLPVGALRISRPIDD